MTKTEAGGVAVTSLTARFGAVIGGVDLADDLDEATVAAIRATLVERGVVFFRGQHLDGEGQERFARRLGPLTAGHPTISSPKARASTLDLDSEHGGRADY